jgi:hydrogenase 3 maturation protease
MCARPWQTALRETLAGLRASGRTPRVAVVGVGHALCGDDAVGCYLARRLRSLAGDDERLLVVDAGPAPENFGGSLRRFRPELVLLADAAQMGAPPGAVRWLDWRAAAGLDASTHTLPLGLFAEYLVAELGCQVALLGVQPARHAFGSPLTPVARQAAEASAAALAEIIYSNSLKDQPDKEKSHG